MTTIDALNDPALSVPRRELQGWRKICDEKHAMHMRLVGQAGWYRELMEKADKMKAEQEVAAAAELPALVADALWKPPANVKRRRSKS